ncbi:hypothetical protein Sjap_000659 [Stephania japonica]|uniref:Uncharacterized protein n=1 Tax=Stephania japonica TaxID=461633 RepID=A0AAP0KKQ5_9MAGN
MECVMIYRITILPLDLKLQVGDVVEWEGTMAKSLVFHSNPYVPTEKSICSGMLFIQLQQKQQI